MKNSGIDSIVKSDCGWGVTQKTKAWVEKNIAPKTIVLVYLNRNLVHKKKTGMLNMRALDSQGFEYVLSGFEWGYGGEGPHGLVWFLNKYANSTNTFVMGDVARLKGDKFKIEFNANADVFSPME